MIVDYRKLKCLNIYLETFFVDYAITLFYNAFQGGSEDIDICLYFIPLINTVMI